jgi:hypothetical protein
MEVLGQRALPPKIEISRNAPVVRPNAPSAHPAGSPEWFTEMEQKYTDSYRSILRDRDVPLPGLFAELRKELGKPDVLVPSDQRNAILGQFSEMFQGRKSLSADDWMRFRKNIARDRSRLPAGDPRIDLFDRLVEATNRSIRSIPGLRKVELDTLNNIDDAYAQYKDLKLAQVAGKSGGATPKTLEDVVTKRGSETAVTQGTARGQDIAYPLARTVSEPRVQNILQRSLPYVASAALLGGPATPMTMPLALAGLALSGLSKAGSTRTGAQILRGDKPIPYLAELLRRIGTFSAAPLKEEE